MKNNLNFSFFLFFLFAIVSAGFSQSFISPNDIRFDLYKKTESLKKDNALQIVGYNTLSRKYLRSRVTDDLKNNQNSSNFRAQLIDDLDNMLKPSFSSDFIDGDVNIIFGSVYTSSPEVDVINIRAKANSLLDDSSINSEARLKRRGVNTFIEPTLRIGLGRNIDLNSRLFFLYNNNEEFSFEVHNASLAIFIENLNIEIGRNTFDWSLGRIKSYNFSGNHSPMWTLRISNDEEIVLPGFLKKMGPVKYETFISILDDERLFKNPLLVGHKLIAKPHSRLELGASYTVMFSGKDANSNNPLVYLGDSFVEEGGVSNRNFIFDIRYEIIPELFEAYTELLVEDCCSKTIIDKRNDMNLFGVHFPNIDGQGKLEASLEYARTSPIAYRHGNYIAGYKNDDKILGHSIGPDGRGLYAQVRYFWNRAFWCTINSSMVKRGVIPFSEVDDPTDEYEVPETRYNILSSCNLKINENNMWLSGEMGYEHVGSFNYKNNAEKDFFLSGIMAKYYF